MEGSILILHDGDCKEFEVDALPGEVVNPPAWSSIHKGETVEIPPEHPLVGWRVIFILTLQGRVIRFGEYGLDGPFTGWLHAAEARCVWNPYSADSADTVPPWNHESFSPDPDCQCGYRIVHDTADLNMLIRQQTQGHGTSMDLRADEVPGFDWEEFGVAPDEVVRSDIGLVSVVGVGRAAACDFKSYRDPDKTLRCQTLAASPNVIVEDCSAVGLLREFGVTVSVVGDVRRVHEPGRCDDVSRLHDLWRMDSVESEVPSERVRLEHPSSRGGVVEFTQHGKWGQHGAAGVALVRDGRVLMVRQSGGHGWQLPGGALNDGETPGQAATREAFEETGLNVSGAEVQGAFAFSDLSGWTYTTIVADCPVGEPVARGEVDEVGWFDLPPEGTHPDLVDSWPRLASLIG